jgi:hypothetical protein
MMFLILESLISFKFLAVISLKGMICEPLRTRYKTLGYVLLAKIKGAGTLIRIMNARWTLSLNFMLYFVKLQNPCNGVIQNVGGHETC